MSEKNEILFRLMNFVEEKGGKSRVARKINKTPQMLSNLERRNAYPEMPTLKVLGDEYPDLDFNLLIRGRKVEDMERLMAELDLLKKENEHLKRTNSVILKMVESTQLGKCKGATIPQLCDIEGASEILLNAGFLNILGSQLGSHPAL